MKIETAHTTKEAYGRLLPNQALVDRDDPRYVELDTARGRRNLANVLHGLIVDNDNVLLATPDAERACFLVTGHPGCGKSTELFRLADLLTKSGFAVVRFEAEEQFDIAKQAVSWWNVLLEIAFQIEEQLSPGVKIPAELLDEAAEWFARVVTKKVDRSEIEVGLAAELSVEAGLSFFAKAKLAIKSLVKQSSSTVKEIELEAERRPLVLTDAVAKIVDYANAAVREKGKRGIVVIADGLEKLPMQVLGGELTTHNALFMQNSLKLKSPPCHLVYTFPLALLSSANLLQYYSEAPLVMPMVHVRNVNGVPDESALSLMREVIGRRADLSLFADGVVDKLALASGGHVRDFLRLVREAVAGRGDTVTDDDADLAIDMLTDYYNNLVQADFISSLDFVRELQQLPGRQPVDGYLVSLLLVLGYQNGQRWNRLHPCVESAPRYIKTPRP